MTGFCKLWNHSLWEQILWDGRNRTLNGLSFLRSWGLRLCGVTQRTFAPSDKIWTLHVNTISFMNSSIMVTNSLSGWAEQWSFQSRILCPAVSVLKKKKLIFKSCKKMHMLRTCPTLVARSTVYEWLQPSEQGYSVPLTVKFEGYSRSELLTKKCSATSP